MWWDSINQFSEEWTLTMSQLYLHSLCKDWQKKKQKSLSLQGAEFGEENLVESGLEQLYSM